jgi:uncharacterized membrane protein YhaH (DUF805 family)
MGQEKAPEVVWPLRILSFSGKAGRQEFSIIAAAITAWITAVIWWDSSRRSGGEPLDGRALLGMLSFLVAIVMLVFAMVRRLNDMGHHWLTAKWLFVLVYGVYVGALWITPSETWAQVLGGAAAIGALIWLGVSPAPKQV